MGSENGSYVLCPRDHRVIRLTIELLEKALDAPFMTAARMVSVGKVLHVLRRLPLPSEDLRVRLDITGPTRTFQDRRIEHSWSVDLDNGCITISSGGYFFRPSSGGDSFSCMSWTAWPGVEAEHADYWAGLRIVDDAQPFEEEVTALNLREPGYGLIVNDDENPLLDEDAEEGEESEEGYEWFESEDTADEQCSEEDHRAERTSTGGGPSVAATIKAQAHGPTMDLLARELPRVESLFQQCPPTHPERPLLTRALTLFYGQLNRMVAAAAMEMNYPLKQWEWPNSLPLEAVAQAYPNLGLEATEWYQRHLGMLMMEPLEPDHLWWNLALHEDVVRASGGRQSDEVAKQATTGLPDALQKAAESLVAAAGVSAVCMFNPILDKFPSLCKADPTHWDFIVTVAGVFMAASRLKNLAVGDAREEVLMEIVAESLEEWDSDGIRAFDDCKRFYEDQYDRFAAAGHNAQFLASDSVGKWIVWNVLGRAPRSHDEVNLTRTVGAMVTHAFFDWWKAE